MDNAGRTIHNIAVLIPAYQPGGELAALAAELAELGFAEVLVVDDGSDAKCAEVFEKAAAADGCRVLHLGANRGKGAALKAGFAELLAGEPRPAGCVTADADGQHLPADIHKLAAELVNHPDSLILGVRDFLRDDVPSRSKTGNDITRVVFKLLTGRRVSDTQTGLRAIPAAMMRQYGCIAGNRYDFEMNMLIEAARDGADIIETPITTVYHDNNSSSHFNALWDSIRIYAHILRYFVTKAFVRKRRKILDFTP